MYSLDILGGIHGGSHTRFRNLRQLSRPGRRSAIRPGPGPGPQPGLNPHRDGRGHEVARCVAGLVAAILFVASHAAHAVTFDVIGISGANPAAMLPGETITIDVRVTTDGDEVYGLGASVYGYDEATVDYVDASGQAVDDLFYFICLPLPTGCLAGLPNFVENPLTETSIGSQGNRVWLFTGSRIGVNSAGPDDPGLDGVIGGGDAQFRVTFEAVSPGSAQILIGTGYEGDGVVLDGGAVVQATPASIEIVVLDGQAPGVPSLQPKLLHLVLPALLLLAGVAGLRFSGNSRLS